MKIAYVVHVETEGEHNRIMNQRKRIPKNVYFLTDYNSHYHYIRTIPGMQYDAVVVANDARISFDGFEYLLTRLRPMDGRKSMLSLNSFHKNMLKKILERQAYGISQTFRPEFDIPMLDSMRKMCELAGIDWEFLKDCIPK
ncbi:hypothetical protein Hena1_00110 [Erwinia phage Hena1]|uniref:Uncharacterized protein n=1 Tax=Erwinia phage Hena1 TaxID=2678601 RepID=A0A6B9JI24_9CAUD|nr:hypothetical protein HWC84_gp010 [Erwinia phage Hena1]QGZ16187.1 hypothetical protein Hena1_00110 [Erwinia phage Hena1]